MKIVLFPLACLLFTNFSIGQQDKQFTHYLFDKISYNPATTGFNGYSGTLIYRNQWDRVENAPNTTLLNLQGNFSKQNLGFGISLSNDAIGFQRNNTIVINGAYHLKTYAGTLSGGVGVGIINVGFSPTWVPPETLIDPSLPAPIAGTGFDMNLGLHWQGLTIPYYVGISTTHLIPPTLNSINFSVARHYYVLAGYDFNLNQRIDLKPSILIKADGATTVFDVNITGNFWMKQSSYFWGGLSYRLEDAVAFNLGYAFSPAENIKVNMMKIGYSLDIITNPLNVYGRGSHELILDFWLFAPPSILKRHGNPFILE